MTTLNNDELRDNIKNAIWKTNPEQVDSSVEDAASIIIYILQSLIATHDQQLLEAILEGAEPNPTTPAGENEFVPVEHIKSVFNKEGES